MSSPPAGGSGAEELRKQAEEAERQADWDRAEVLWRELRELPPFAEEAERAGRRLDEKRSIFRKIDSMLPGGGHHSYVGLDDFVTVGHDGIDVRFHLRQPDVDLKRVIGALRRARLKVEERLGYRPDGVTVELLRSRDELAEAARREREAPPPPWAVATSGGCIRVALDGPEAAEPHRLVVTLTHEYVHQAVRHLGRGRCPRWLDEGLAVAFSQELPRGHRQMLDEALQSRRTLDPVRLSGDFAQLGDRQAVALAYAQSASLVEYLVERDGWPGLRQLLDDLAELGFEGALQRRGEQLYLLGREWERWARARRKDAGS